MSRSAAFALLALSFTTVLWSADYALDPTHSSASFRIKHLYVSSVLGRFNDMAGTITYDPAEAAKCAVAITIKATSVDTGTPARDEHLRGAEFFAATQHPTLTFTSRAWKKTADDRYEISGDFSLHGVSKPITVTAEKTGEGKGMKGEPRLGFETTFTIKRSDYGMTTMVGPVADEVKITLTVEAAGLAK